MENELEYPETMKEGYVPVKTETLVRLTHLAGITERLVNNEVEVRLREAESKIRGQLHSKICGLERELRLRQEGLDIVCSAQIKWQQKFYELDSKANRLKENFWYKLFFGNRYL